MSEDKEVLGAETVLGSQALPKPKVGSGVISLTPEQLQAIIVSAVEGAGEKQAKILAEALIESKKPYVDPKQAENAEADRKRDAEIQARMRENLKRDRQNCKHIRGSNALSDWPDDHNLTSIIHHQLDNGKLIGICTNCQRVWYPGDADYNEWMSKRSGNRMSLAGQRFGRYGWIPDTNVVPDAGGPVTTA